MISMDHDEESESGGLEHINHSTEKTFLLGADSRNGHEEKSTTKSAVTSSSSAESEKEDASYADIIMSNRPFRLYLCSYLISHTGEWFTYVASIELLEQILGVKRAGSRRYVSYLVVCRLIPNFLLIPFGGVLADARDKRHTMIVLDAVGAITPLFYLLASHFRSIEIIYMVTLLQASIAALYEPCRSSIIPLMVTDDEPLKKATTLAGLAWSVVSALGSSIGGYLVPVIGVNACFAADSITFMISGLLMYQVGGKWDVSDNEKNHLSVWAHFQDMTVGGFTYIVESSFWPLVLIKVTIALVYGGADVLNVSFAEQDPASTEQEQSQKLGALFFVVAVGYLIGPVLMDPLTNMKNPMTVMNAVVASFAIESIGYFIMGAFASFSCILAGTFFRAAGTAIAWIDSQVLLQAVVKPNMLGRVMAVDYGLGLLAESMAALIVGSVLQDGLGLSAMQVSTISSIASLVLFLSWLAFRVKGSETALQLN